VLLRIEPVAKITKSNYILTLKTTLKLHWIFQWSRSFLISMLLRPPEQSDSLDTYGVSYLCYNEYANQLGGILSQVSFTYINEIYFHILLYY